MVERFNAMGWVAAAEDFFIPALQMASHKTASYTKIKLFAAVTTYFARGYYTTEQRFWLRPGYDVKERAIEWFRTILSLHISYNHSDRQTLHTSLLFAEFLIQSRGCQQGALRLEPRKIPTGQRLDAKNLLNFVEDRLENLTKSKIEQALFLVTKFDYGICCKNYKLSLEVHQQGVDLGKGLFTDLLYSWFPFGEPPLPEFGDAQHDISGHRRREVYTGISFGGDVEEDEEDEEEDEEEGEEDCIWLMEDFWNKSTCMARKSGDDMIWNRLPNSWPFVIHRSSVDCAKKGPVMQT